LFASLGAHSVRAGSSGRIVGAWRLVSFNVDEGRETEKPPEIWGTSNVLVWKRA
jgi:hypothetical protein